MTPAQMRSRRILSHPRQDLGDVIDRGPFAQPMQLALDIEQASDIAGNHAIRAACSDVFDLVLDNAA